MNAADRLSTKLREADAPTTVREPPLRSIIYQVMIPSLFLVILGFLAVGVFAARSKASSMSDIFRRKAELSATLSQEGAASGLWQFDKEAFQTTLAPILADRDFKSVIVRDSKGEVFYSKGHPVDEAVIRAITKTATEAGRPMIADSGDSLFSAVPLNHSEAGEILPLGTMVIEYDKHSVTTAVWSATLWVAGIVAVAVAIFSSALVALLRRISTPLTRLVSSMASLSEGQLADEIRDLNRPDEIGAMARSVQVFKENALRLRSSELETAHLRDETERQRSKSDAERAAMAAQQAQVVAALGIGLENLSRGKLIFRIANPFPATYEKLRANFNGAMERMQETMAGLLDATTTIQSGTEQITAGADDLSERTGEQAASLKQTATALEEITATVRKSADGAGYARKIMTTAKSDVERSGVLMTDAIKAMGGIEKHSIQIGQIVGVIDQLAFQTNLLALNAGVEAARAGDSGRGFAVVASEVRALALRSAQAAREIKSLISSSKQQVDQGVLLVSKTGDALASIVRQVTEISSAVSEISTGAHSQMLSLQDISKAVNQVDDVTQLNAAMVEQTTAASHELAQEARALVRLVEGFELRQPTAAAEAVRPWRPTVAATG